MVMHSAGHRGGGRGGIRTPERLTPLTVFKTAAFNHSATRPCPLPTLLVAFGQSFQNRLKPLEFARRHGHPKTIFYDILKRHHISIIERRRNTLCIHGKLIDGTSLQITEQLRCDGRVKLGRLLEGRPNIQRPIPGNHRARLRRGQHLIERREDGLGLKRRDCSQSCKGTPNHTVVAAAYRAGKHLSMRRQQRSITGVGLDTKVLGQRHVQLFVAASQRAGESHFDIRGHWDDPVRSRHTSHAATASAIMA